MTVERDDTRRQVNELSKQVGRLRRDGADDEAERLMAESRALGDTRGRAGRRGRRVEAELRELLLRIPNLPSRRRARRR